MPAANNPHDVFKYVKFPLNPDGTLKPSLNPDGSANKEACWLWEGPTGGRDKRPLFAFNGRRLTAYRMVWELQHGTLLASDELLMHQCDVPQCCNPDHLRVGTPGENMKEMVQRERVGMPHRKVQEIMRLIDKGFKQTDIARVMGKSRRLISDIANRTRYREVPWPGRDDDKGIGVPSTDEGSNSPTDDGSR